MISFGNSANDLPVGILADDQVVSERIEVASPDFDPLTVVHRARQRPLTHSCACFFINKMNSVTVVDIGQAFEPAGQSSPNSLLTFHATAPRLIASWHLQDAVVGKQGHDAIKIVGVEALTQFLKPFPNDAHTALLPARRNISVRPGSHFEPALSLRNDVEGPAAFDTQRVRRPGPSEPLWTSRIDSLPDRR
jgi:hypothetical protein